VPTTGPDDPKGVAPGFYRIEITKAGDNIPAKYNSETTLGQAVGVPPSKGGRAKGVITKFDLKY
jgi:hypothetical protein